MTQTTDIKTTLPPLPAWKRPVKQAFSRRRIRTGLLVTLVGLVIFLLGARPALFGADRSPVIGFIQIAVFLIGLALVCLGGYLSLMALWKDRQTSISADIGLRLVATGYVIAVFAGMADIFGFGSHPLPGIPYFGTWQARGVEFGQAMIAIGFLMLIPLRGPRTEPKHTPASN
ncbi:MAG TPA: hypothetical protein VN364_00690 [Bellilinea sp.]|nr:hypothetical protein [Bellilinea sp.]